MRVYGVTPRGDGAHGGGVAARVVHQRLTVRVVPRHGQWQRLLGGTGQLLLGRAALARPLAVFLLPGFRFGRRDRQPVGRGCGQGDVFVRGALLAGL